MYEEMIEDSLQYIEENVFDNLTLRRISDHFNMSSFHFSRIFSFMIGEPYRQYLLKRKMSHSLVMLNENASIIDTAYSYGFTYPESYTRAFKQVFGISPKKYQSNKNLIQPYGIGKVITRDLVNFKGELYIRSDYEFMESQRFYFDEIKIDKSNPNWMKDIYQAGDCFLENTQELPFINQRYYFNSVKCEEYQMKYAIRFMKLTNKKVAQPDDKIIVEEGGWFAKFHYVGKIKDIYDSLEIDIKRWIERKDEKLEYVGNGIIIRYELSDLSQFDIMVRLKRKLNRLKE